MDTSGRESPSNLSSKTAGGGGGVGAPSIGGGGGGGTGAPSIGGGGGGGTGAPRIGSLPSLKAENLAAASVKSSNPSLPFLILPYPSLYPHRGSIPSLSFLVPFLILPCIHP